MHANAGSPHASLPDSDVALLANILVLATRNMNNMTTMLAHLRWSSARAKSHACNGSVIGS